jgi:hypothetical protein
MALRELPKRSLKTIKQHKRVATQDSTKTKTLLLSLLLNITAAGHHGLLAGLYFL